MVNGIVTVSSKIKAINLQCYLFLGRKVTVLQTNEAFVNNFVKTQNIDILPESFLPTMFRCSKTAKEENRMAVPQKMKARITM